MLLSLLMHSARIHLTVPVRPTILVALMDHHRLMTQDHLVAILVAHLVIKNRIIFNFKGNTLKRILTLFLSVALIASSAFARAGSSYSRSSSSHSSYGSSSSSSSYSRPTQSYSRPAPTQQRSYAKPNPPRPTAAPVSRPAPTATHTTVNRTTVVHKNYNNGGSNGYNNNRNNNNNNDNGNNGGGFGSNGGGMGIGGTIAGVAGGIVVGNLLTSALMGDHRNAGHVPAGGYQSTPAGVPLAGQPVAPAMAGAESGSYVTDGNGGVVPAEQYKATTTGDQPTPSTNDQSMSGAVSSVSPTPLATASEPHSFDWFSWYMWLVYIALGIGLIMAIIALYRRWRVARDRKLEVAQMLEDEHNLGVFKHIFTQIQSSYASGANINLVHLLTASMYSYITLQRSETEDNGLINIIEEVKVLSAVNVRSWESDGIQFQQVKIRFSMIDYTVDSDDVVHHGSKTTPETAVEYWTFQSSSKGVWVLASIDQHAGYVHQITD